MYQSTLEEFVQEESNFYVLKSEYSRNSSMQVEPECTYLNKVPEKYLTVLWATDHMTIIMGEAAVQLVVTIDMTFVST